MTFQGLQKVSSVTWSATQEGRRACYDGDNQNTDNHLKLHSKAPGDSNEFVDNETSMCSTRKSFLTKDTVHFLSA
ncbi:hypothetical protein ColTof4_07854 [Colletotrichum tofieldiae]|nr:hypothetical protein ColTof3_02617 [Colletotrichum tofieldiae]GKT75431.1 hypothetical protein ColTof4_07854 [Colletotrichum tofieldiae]GKT83100.1 hypothetical protein Ct61P_00950 [Colletotrichum tofieldiae]